MGLFRQPTRRADFEAAALPFLEDIFRAARRMAADQSHAEDLVQQVYLTAWKVFDRFQPGTNCKAWLFKILFNEILHHRRRLATDPTVRGNSELEQTYEPPVPEELRDEDMLRAIDDVSEDFRKAVLLADVHEFSYKEIAEILGIPVGTVMSRLNRGRKLFRSKLARFAGLDNGDQGGRTRSGSGQPG